MLDDKEKAKQEDEKDEEKNEKKDLGDIEINSPEELQELLDRLAGSGKSNGKNVKKIGIVNRLFPNIFVNLLFYVGLYLVITLAMQGYFQIFIYKNFYELLLFTVMFSVLDTLIKDLLYSKIPFIVLTSFGIVILITTVITSFGSLWIIPNLLVQSTSYFILYISIILIVRTVITHYLTRVRLHRLHLRRPRNKR